MDFDGLDADVQRLGDLLVQLAVKNQRHHLALALGQLAQLGFQLVAAGQGGAGADVALSAASTRSINTVSSKVFPKNPPRPFSAPTPPAASAYWSKIAGGQWGWLAKSFQTKARPLIGAMRTSAPGSRCARRQTPPAAPRPRQSSAWQAFGAEQPGQRIAHSFVVIDNRHTAWIRNRARPLGRLGWVEQAHFPLRKRHANAGLGKAAPDFQFTAERRPSRPFSGSPPRPAPD